MELTEVMRFLSPAIEKQNKILPVLSHIRITQGYAIAYNGMLAMAAPISLPLTCTPNGLLLEKAVERFGNEFSATQKPNGDLFFKGGGFSVTIPCTTDEFPMPNFDGQPATAGKGLLDKLKKLLPFTLRSEDDPWMGTILLREGNAIATCGHTLAWMPVDMVAGVELAIPADAAKAMVELKEEPEYLARSQDRFVAIYSGGRFMSCPLVHTGWPKTDNLVRPQTVGPIPAGLWDAVRAVRPFTLPGENSGTFYLLDDAVASDRNGIGARMEVPGLVGGLCWYYPSVKLIEKHATGVRLEGRFGGWAGDGIQGRMRFGTIEK